MQSTHSGSGQEEAKSPQREEQLLTKPSPWMGRLYSYIKRKTMSVKKRNWSVLEIQEKKGKDWLWTTVHTIREKILGLRNYSSPYLWRWMHQPFLVSCYQTLNHGTISPHSASSLSSCHNLASQLWVNGETADWTATWGHVPGVLLTENSETSI